MDEGHIAVVGANSYKWSVTYLAVTCSNNVIVPIDKELTVDNMMDVIKDSDTIVLFGLRQICTQDRCYLEIAVLDSRCLNIENKYHGLQICRFESVVRNWL